MPKGKLPIKRYCHSIRHGQFLAMPFCCSRFDFGVLSDNSGGRAVTEQTEEAAYGRMWAGVCAALACSADALDWRLYAFVIE